MLGLLLEINDNQLERIQTRHSSNSQRQEAMIIHWISTGHAYWSVLVDVLKGPVLGEIDLANSLIEKHLGMLHGRALFHYRLNVSFLFFC